MKVNEAITILKEYVDLDRQVRDTEDCSNDFDKFCEEKCVAIETLIKYVEDNCNNKVNKSQCDK